MAASMYAMSSLLLGVSFASARSNWFWSSRGLTDRLLDCPCLMDWLTLDDEAARRGVVMLLGELEDD
jgi:hypothetical protein